MKQYTVIAAIIGVPLAHPHLWIQTVTADNPKTASMGVLTAIENSGAQPFEYVVFPGVLPHRTIEEV